MTRRNAHIWGDTRCLGGTSVNGLYGKAPTERSTFFRLQVYETYNSHTYQSLTPRAFPPPPGKALDEANYMYLPITNRRYIVEIKTVFPSSKVTVKKVQYYSVS